MKASLRRWHKAQTTIFTSAKAEDCDISLTNSKKVSQKKIQKRNIPKANKFRYVTPLAVTALRGYDHGLLIGNSHGKKERPTMLTNGIYSLTSIWPNSMLPHCPGMLHWRRWWSSCPSPQRSSRISSTSRLDQAVGKHPRPQKLCQVGLFKIKKNK